MLIELFSRDHGRVGLVARGARGARSPWRGLGEPFVPLEAEWTRRGEMGTLVRLEPSGQRPQLSGRSLWCGLYANELVVLLTGRDEPMPELHLAYDRLLGSLAEETRPARSLRRFELALLQALGVAPDLVCEAGSAVRVRRDGWYRLEPDAGLFPVAAPGGRHVYSGEAILSLSTEETIDSGNEREARDITRCLLDHQLDGRALKTRELFRSMQ